MSEGFDNNSSVANGSGFTNQTSFYDLLEVAPSATQKEIKAQFLKLSLKYHPDKQDTGDAHKFKSLMQAYKVLSSKKRRKTYDDSLSNTWNELRDATRNTEYEVTDQHTKLDDAGNRVFDEKSFNDAFNTKRNDADASEIHEMLNDLEKSGRVVDETADAQVDAWSHLQDEREKEEALRIKQVETMEGNTLNDLRSEFNPNIFNQMFNDMKAKKTELVDYDMRNDDEFLQHADQGPMGMWQGQGGADGSMFGTTSSSNMGGLEALGGLRANGGDDQLIQEFGNRVYEEQPEITFTRDMSKEDRDSQMSEYERRIAQIEEDRKNLMHMSKEDYIIRDSVIAQALGIDDPSLFDNTIPALDPGAKETGDDAEIQVDAQINACEEGEESEEDEDGEEKEQDEEKEDGEESE